MDEFPGLGLPLRHQGSTQHGFYPIGAHANCSGSESEIFPVRELAMMDIMEKLTDKEDWHKKVFDESIVAQWRKEALAIPDKELWHLAIGAKVQQWDYGSNGRQVLLQDDYQYLPEVPRGIMSEDAFSCCVEELRSKAKYFEQTGIIPTLDVCASVAKSDTLVSAELHDAIQNAFDKLKVDHNASPDWHPNSNDMVQDLVHPSMYPLVYGRSRAFQETCVGVADAIGQWAGTGDIVPKCDWKDDRAQGRYRSDGDSIPSKYWSETYQWLPANVAFQENGDMKFTSYVNNLHPTKYPGIYRTLEKLIKTSLPMWDQCLAIFTSHGMNDGAGRTKPRFGKSDYPDDENPDNWIPNNPEECANVEVTSEQLYDKGYSSDDSNEDTLKTLRWELVRQPCIPEPSFEDVNYAPGEGKRLIDRFRESGLQIIVKMASIELTPEKPEFPAGGWHVEGQMNEHICATALYYLDSENITNSSLSFRMQTTPDLHDDQGYDVGQNAYHWLESVYGTSLGGGSPCLQNYGTVETRQGRLLAFPNVFQHRVSPFRLIDPTRPGHRRFIALWLVDPNQRIISTANVPPQQMTWYADSVLGSTPSARTEALSKLPTELVALLKQHGPDNSEVSENGTLPEELMNMVRDHFNEEKETFPMGVEEAREHREKLMKERGAFQETSGLEWQQQSYGFCEH